MPNVTTVRGSTQNLLTTELNSLANNSNAVHASSVTLTNAGYRGAELELLVTFGVAPTANTAFLVWLLREIDGTNFEDGSASITPTRTPDAIFTVRAVTTAQRMIAVVDLPAGFVRPLIRNAGTGQAIASSGNTLIVRANTESF
jgi:hypothetical protein